MAILKRTISSNKEELCQISNIKRDQEFSIIFYKNGTYKLTQDGREIQKNKVAYQRIIKKILEV